MEKTNLPAPKIEFSLGFFARLIWADTSMLHFAVLIRHFNEDGIDGKVQHPAISITGLDKYAFDLCQVGAGRGTRSRSGRCAKKMD